MNKRVYKISTILVLVIIYSLLYKFVIFDNYKMYAEYITSAFSAFIVFLSYLFFGYQKDKPTELKKTIITIEIVVLLAFFSIYYGSGLFLGYLESPYALNLTSIIGNILPLLITLTCIELFRYIVINSDRDNKIIRIILLISICIFEITVMVTGQDLSSYEGLFKAASQIIIPIIAKNYTFTYLDRYVGLKPSLLFRLIIDMYIYLVPIIPDIGDYFNSVVKIGLPMLLLVFTYRAIDDAINGVEYDFKKNMLRKNDIPVIVLLLIISCLISGKFNYFLIGIGSDSMSPAIHKGDAVLISKHKNNVLKKGEIIAYRSNGIVIIHRIVQVEKKKNKYYYIVQGDANNTPDNELLPHKEVIGVVKLKIPVIGYPSVILSELFKNGI
ncbi:MAG: signal peptidase I [Bacilli bacterium]|nr:signal peptidase I [Bacilli bacterium]